MDAFLTKLVQDGKYYAYGNGGYNDFVICLGYKGYLIKEFLIIIFYTNQILQLI